MKDYQNRIYSDLDIELTKQTDGDIKVDIDEEAIKNSLNNIVRTIQGSRRMLPKFASRINNLLFEPVDFVTTNELRDELIDAILEWDDRIIIEDINIEIQEDNYQIKGHYLVSMNFKLKQRVDIKGTLKFILYTS